MEVNKERSGHTLLRSIQQGISSRTEINSVPTNHDLRILVHYPSVHQHSTDFSSLCSPSPKTA